MKENVLILLIRHGETDWNAQNRVQGHIDIPLNEKGKAQARALAELIVQNHPDLAFIYSSDLDRAYATAQETAERFKMKIDKRPNFREMHYGEAEGKTYEERKQLYDSHIPQSETRIQLLERMKNELEKIVVSHLGQKIAIFSHGRAIKTLMEDCLDQEIETPLPNCALVCFSYSPQEKTFKFIKIEDPAV